MAIYFVSVVLSLLLAVVAKDADGSKFSVPLIPKPREGWRVKIGIGCGSGRRFIDVDVFNNDDANNVDSTGISAPVAYSTCSDSDGAQRRDDKLELRRLLRREGDYTCCCCAFDYCYESSYWEPITVGKNITAWTQVYHDTCWGYDDGPNYDRPEGSFAIRGIHGLGTSSDFTRQACAFHNQSVSIAVAVGPSALKNSTASLDYCGVDLVKYVSPIDYHTLDLSTRLIYYGNGPSTSPLSGLAFGNTTIALASNTRIIFFFDPSEIFLPSDAALKQYLNMTGAVKDTVTGFLTVTKKQIMKMPPIHIRLDNKTYSLSADAQLWPQARNHEIGSIATAYYLDICPDAATYLWLGNAFFERYYVNFKTDYTWKTSSVGIAKTHYTDKTINCL